MSANVAQTNDHALPGSKGVAGPKESNKWIRMLAEYRHPKLGRSIFELAITAFAFALFWGLAWLSFRLGFWAPILVAIPAGALLMRLFMVQHDCGHGSFFVHRATNDWVGRVIGVLTLTPYGFWRRTHAEHHSEVGDLEHRGTGDILTLTVKEFQTLPLHRRWLYRFYRHPIVMFGLIPTLVFVFLNRVPVGFWRSGPQVWLSTMGTNAAIAMLFGSLIWLMGIGSFLMVELPVVLVAASIGTWFFYVQHQFEDTSWKHHDEWNFHDAALHGSSHYRLPAPLAWLTGNIGVHHVHHLASRIPGYRLSQVLRDHPELDNVGVISFVSSLKCATLALWDEDRHQLISFRRMRQAYAS